MRLALDTNAYRAFVDGDKSAVQILRHADAIFLPVPVLAELRYGFQKGIQGKRNEASLVHFLDSPRVEILNCDEGTTFFFAQLKTQLSRQGTPIPINDLWIASLALQHSLALFTYDRDFDRIPQLARLFEKRY